MTRGILNLQMIGRTGNQCLQYLHARAIAERDNLELRTPRWVGEKIFQIEPTAEPDYSGEFLHGYFQNQESAIYTLRQVREWFRWRPEIEMVLKTRAGKEIVGHLRRGDYIGYGMPTISVQSYYHACHKFKLDPTEMCFVTDTSGVPESPFYNDFPWLPDFYIMSTAKTLLRANSSFSFVAGMLNPNRVLSPDISGKVGGQEHLCEFHEGNHQKLADLTGITEMRIAP